MGEYTLTVFRKLLCVALIFSLLWPDVAKCMDDEEEKLPQQKHVSLPIYLLSGNRGDQKRDLSLKNEQQHSLTLKENKPLSKDLQEDANNPTLSEKDNVTEEVTNNNENSSSDSSAVTTKEIQPPVLEDKEEISKENSSDNKVSPGEQKDPSPELKDKEDIEGGENVNPEDAFEIILIREDDGEIKKKCKNKASNCQKFSFKERNDDGTYNQPISSFYADNKEAVVEEDYSGPQLGSHVELTETSSLLGRKCNIQGNLLHQETLSEQYLRLLRINSQNLTKEELDTFDKLVKVEGTWRNYLVFSYWENIFHRILFALTTDKSAVNSNRHSDPLWLYGGPLPVKKSAVKRNIILKTASNTLEEGILEHLNAILTTLMGYQIYELIKSPERIRGLKNNIKFAWDFYSGVDIVSTIAILNVLSEHKALFALLGGPVIFAAVKTVLSLFQLSEPTAIAVGKRIKDINDRSLGWDSWVFNMSSFIPLLSSLLMFHPVKSQIPSLATLILWNGELSDKIREKAFNALVQLAKTRKGISQMTAIESLIHLTYGLNVRNLTLHPHGVEGLLKIKLGASQALKEVYEDLPYFSLNKLRTATRLWEIGRSPSWRVSVIEPVIKAILGTLYGLSLYGFGNILYEYWSCPEKYRKSFSWLGGLQPYASNYSEDCFISQLKVFNLIPGQPAYTLVGHDPANRKLGNLSAFNFTNYFYDLDLSNKNIEGEVIAVIVKAFRLASAKVSLDLR